MIWGAKMELYVSDLDGTLLNSDKEISGYTKNIINALTAGGKCFTVATARTAVSVLSLLTGVNINIPVILMNGVMVYDLHKEEYIKIEAIPEQTALTVDGIIKKHGMTGFMYALCGNGFTTYYEALETAAMKDFHDERVKRYAKYFEQTDSFDKIIGGNNIIYFSMTDEKGPLSAVYEELKELPDINAVLYKDNYTEKMWYLEIYSKNASKSSAVKYIRTLYGFDDIIGFGDNINDLPLFDACDECYAVSNAVGQLKDKAHGIIGDNDSDGVARFIADREKLL
jgi:5-amino-6-(5-phospho-D-ribitylamino)uracil phosphatase